MASLFQRLRERKLVQWGLGYLAGAFVAVQLMDALEGPLGLSRQFQLAVLVLLIAGFPIAVVIAWYHGERGRQRATWSELILISVLLGVGVMLFRQVPDDEATTDLDPNRIAVLYFVDETGTDELAPITTGLTAHLIAELDQVPALDVVSINGVKRYRDQSLPPETIAQELAAGSIVAGSVQRVTDTLVVFVQLIDGATGNTLDTRRVRRAYAESFSLQRDLASEVASSLRRRLGREVRVRELTERAPSTDAWLALQQAVNLRDDARELRAYGDSVAAAYRVLDRAGALIEEARRIDPDWVDPVLLDGWILVDRIGLPYVGSLEAARTMAAEGIELAERALAMEPGARARGLELRGVHRFHLLRSTNRPAVAEEQLDLSEADLREAVGLDPSLATAWNALSGVLWTRGQFAEAGLAGRKALEADAYLEDARETISRLFYAHLQTGEYAEAEQWCTRGGREFPQDWRFVECHLTLLAYAQSDIAPDVDRAHRLFERSNEMSPHEVRTARLGDRLIRLTAVLARAGMVDSALVLLDSTRAVRMAIPEHTTAFLHEEAYIRLLLGQPDRALDLLEIYVERAPHYREYLARDVTLSSLRPDPRFQALLTGPS